ncbi:substrate-binding domain-containing protein [Flavobacterium weaverense]|uniref:Extracellular solute-binding protein n=1 Tax=Flavobacterium weaverense TaxID=271156 RepID=A0A3L9ZJV6_9FLAO|nr:substrate-binding domain-containing protein [Flavobacterium weaverense]RMA73153.1 extracellular solute-binding protein [Flavobacterium weaverense]
MAKLACPTDFVKAMDGGIDETTVEPLYLRPSGLLVRPGNPKNIKDFDDIERAGLKIMVVNGAGQTGLWEGMAGKQGCIKTVKAVRKNIVNFASNSGEAKQYWIDHPEVDVWIIWNIWQVSNPNIADFVPVSKKYVLYRDAGVALTKTGSQKEDSKEFYKFLMSKEASPIFKKWGWITK